MTQAPALHNVGRNRLKEARICLELPRSNAAHHRDYGPIEDWSSDVDGYTINFATFRVDL